MAWAASKGATAGRGGAVGLGRRTGGGKSTRRRRDGIAALLRAAQFLDANVSEGCPSWPTEFLKSYGAAREAIQGINVIQDILAVDLDNDVITTGNEMQMEPLIVLTMAFRNPRKSE